MKRSNSMSRPIGAVHAAALHTLLHDNSALLIIEMMISGIAFLMHGCSMLVPAGMNIIEFDGQYRALMLQARHLTEQALLPEKPIQNCPHPHHRGTGHINVVLVIT